MEYLVSVIIPIYNTEKYIQSCVESVILQSYSNIEVILINDGSTDDSLTICKNLTEKYPNCLLINQENKGVSEARNRGMKEANGKYLFFLDADDTLPKDAIKILVESAANYDSDMVIGNFSSDLNIKSEVFEGEEYLKKVLEDNCIAYHVWGILYRKSFLKNLYFPKGYVVHEDSYFMFLCALKMPRVATINSIVYNYNSLESNSSSRSPFTIKKYNSICELLSLKEIEIESNFPHLLPLFYHLKTKTQMALLLNLIPTKGKEFRKREQETLKRFHETKNYFRNDLPYANARFYKVVSFNMYYLYKFLIKTKKKVKVLLHK
jgi:glycosyltransferase involved in cell wall biosynthesis